MRTLRHLPLLSIVVACSALSACATTSSTASLRPADATRADTAYMAKVNYIAQQRGVQVHWVNPPNEGDRHVASR